MLLIIILFVRICTIAIPQGENQPAARRVISQQCKAHHWRGNGLYAVVFCRDR